MAIFLETWGGVGAKVRIVSLMKGAAVAHRRFRENGRLGNLTVPAGAGGELPLRRVLAQKHPERPRVSADDCLGDDALRCTKSSAAPFSVAGVARKFPPAFARCAKSSRPRCRRSCATSRASGAATSLSRRPSTPSSPRPATRKVSPPLRAPSRSRTVSLRVFAQHHHRPPARRVPQRHASGVSFSRPALRLARLSDYRGGHALIFYRDADRGEAPNVLLALTIPSDAGSELARARGSARKRVADKSHCSVL